jgi:hypothetical protein
VYFQAGLAIVVTFLAAALLAGALRRRHRSRRVVGGLDLGAATPSMPAGMKHLAIRLNERLPIHLPLPRPGMPSRRLGLLLGLR